MNKVVKILLIIVVLVLILIGITVGACCIMSNSLKQQLSKQETPATMEQISREIANYTLTDNYTLTKSMSILGLKTAVFTYKPNNQLLILAEPPKLIMNINEKNFKEMMTPEKLNEYITQTQTQNLEIKDIQILKEGMLQTSTKQIPFAKVKTTLQDNRSGATIYLEGIIAVATFPDGNKNIVILSGSEPAKFNEQAVLEFVKTLKIS